MKLCRFLNPKKQVCVGLSRDDTTVFDLSAEGIDRLSSLLEFEGLVSQLTRLSGQGLPQYRVAEVTLLAPVDQQEVWAAGVTYLRSKKARMEESDFSASAYDRVYDAVRPEIFFKSLPEKVVAPGDGVGIRRTRAGTCPSRSWRWCSIPAGTSRATRLAMT